MKAIIYIHGKYGSAKEAEHYKALFPDDDVIGLDYKGNMPWDIAKEIREKIAEYNSDHDGIIVIANSIGAYYLMIAGVEKEIDHAYFISPVVDMEKVIRNIMLWANVSEEELKEKGVIQKEGDDLSWDYFCYAKENQVSWHVPTDILYGNNDGTTSFDIVSAFARDHQASLTVMEDGGHWFHSTKQMEFLDNWLRSKISQNTAE